MSELDALDKRLGRAWQALSPPGELQARVRARLSGTGALGIAIPSGPVASRWRALRASGALGASVGAVLLGLGIALGYLIPRAPADPSRSPECMSLVAAAAPTEPASAPASRTPESPPRAWRRRSHTRRALRPRRCPNRFRSQCMGISRLSPDGSQIALISDMSSVQQVWIVPTTGGWPRVVTTQSNPVGAVQWSPTGDWLAHTVMDGLAFLSRLAAAIRGPGFALRHRTDSALDTQRHIAIRPRGGR